MDARLERARHLLSIDRPDDAASLLVAHLGEFPDDAEALGLLSLALLEAGRTEEAIERAEAAIAAGPDELLGWLALGHALHQANRGRRALEAAERAVEVAPDSSAGHALVASVHASAKRWPLALAAADAGLGCDPEDDQCNNVRALALRQLGRHREADAAMREQLRRTPDDALTHANQGWVALQGGDRVRAREHFREALRLDPSLEWARSGLREALMATHWFYRPALRWFLWIERFGAGKQAAILIGGWLIYRFAVRRLREGDDALRWVWIALISAYGLFVVLTWFAAPLAAGLLLLGRDGRRVLMPRERLGALTVCSMLAAGGVLLLAGIADAVSGTWMIAGVTLLLVALPMKVAFDQTSRQARAGMFAFTALCVALGGWIVASIASEEQRVAAIRPHLNDAAELREQAAEYETRRREYFADLGLETLLDPSRPPSSPDAANNDSIGEQIQVRIDAIARSEPDGKARAEALLQRLAALAEERKQLQEATEAFETAARESGAADEIEALQDAKQSGSPLILVLGILCFWVSQFLAGALTARYPE